MNRKIIQKPFYDPTKSYEENYKEGPYGGFNSYEAIKRNGEPKYDFFGHKIYLPFGIPAGPLINANFVESAFKNGFDVCVYKTVRTREYPCHPHPNVLAVHLNRLGAGRKSALKADDSYTTPLSITNSFGVPSTNPKVWQKDLRKAVKSAGKGQVLIGSFQGTSDGSGKVENYINDFVKAAKLVKETGVTVLEANLSCPNEGTANVLCFDTKRTKLIAQEIKKEIGSTPLILKLAYFEDDKKLEHFVKELGSIVDGFSAINTIAAKIVDENGDQALPGKGRERSGVCGTAITWAGLNMVKRLKVLREKLKLDYTIIGVGGVTNDRDFTSYRKRGADLVMSATGAMWNTNLAKKIIENSNTDMKNNKKIKIKVAKALLKIGAVGFKPANPITFKSGLVSPVYIDNRKFPFNPKEWQVIISAFEQIAQENKLKFDVIAGIESAGIPHSAGLGFSLKKPSVFTRKAVKDHGTKKMVEGGIVKNKAVLLIEDHITTGQSSLLGVDALRKEGATVSDCFSITSYDFKEAKGSFEKSKVQLHTLTDFETILDVAFKQKVLTKNEIKVISDWFSDPWAWAKKYGFEN